MKTILLVEDDPILGNGVKINLELEGYNVKWAKNLYDASIQIADNTFDLIILDLGLPDGSGLDFCKENRELSTPIIILTAQTDESTVVKGFEYGATDYVKKPFGTKELHARIKAHLKEYKSSGNQIKFEDLEMALDERNVKYKGELITLNRRRFELLAYFVKNPGIVITRESLMSILGMDEDTLDRTIDVHISQLRSDLKKASITTIKITSIYGVGYRLEKV